MRIKPVLAAIAAAAVIGGGAAVGLLPAGASLLPQYQVVKSGTAGYYAIGSNFHNVGTVVKLDPAAVNIGGVGTGGIGTQLCDPNNGFGLQLGVVSNGSTFSVEYADGILAGANADNCVGNGVLANPHVLNANLTAVQPGDSVQLYTSWANYRTTIHVGRDHRPERVERGRATFQAMDLTSGFEVYTATISGLPADSALSSAGAGIQQDTTGMSACTPVVPFGASNYPTTVNYTGGSGACNDVADFSNVFANGHGGMFGFGPGLATWNAVQVITTGGGLRPNAATVAPNDTLVPTVGFNESAFNVYAGEVLG